MIRRRGIWSRLASLVAVSVSGSLIHTAPAAAGSHLWRFSEFYSSPDRSVQFIEMQEIGGSNNETQIANHWYATNGYNQDHSELLGSNLPFGTANKKFLVGSQSYAALPNVPAPDYVLPDGFLEPAGDTVVWWFYQTLTIPPGLMPSDGTHSLHVDDPGGEPNLTFTVAPSSPTNFAGETGTVTLAPSVPSLSRWGVSAALGALALAAGLGARRRRSSSG